MLCLQVSKLRRININAGYIGGDCDDDIREGRTRIIFTSPEQLLGNDEWRKVLSSDVFQATVRLIVIDEAHTVLHW